jgi:hypothetical protein
VGALAIVAVLVVGGIVAIIAMSGGKKPEPRKPEPKPPPVAPTPPPAPTKPAEKPYPPLPGGAKERAGELLKKFEPLSKDAGELLDEAKRAKAAGNDVEWQRQLKEGLQILSQINDEWNEFEAALPSSADYDQEQVAAHYLARERGTVQKYVKRLNEAKSDAR